MNLKAIFTAKTILIVVLVVLLCAILAALAIYFAADLKTVLVLSAGAFLVIVARFGWLVLQKGWGWGLAKLHGWWNAGKADFAGLETGLSAVEVGLSTLEGRVTAIEQKVLPVLQKAVPQLGPIAPPSVAPPAAPAVQQSPNSNG